VVGFFMALLSFGFDTPSLPAQGEQGPCRLIPTVKAADSSVGSIRFPGNMIP
jgi:hypothetical protein